MLFLTLLLTGLGLIAVADASHPLALRNFGDRFYFIKQQAIWAAIGVALMLSFSKIKYTFWERFALPLFVVAVLFLILVLIPGLGVKLLGARRWFSLGSVSFQPSEIAKLFVAIYIAKVASKNKNIVSYLTPLILIAALVMMQPDFGTTIVITTMVLTQIFISGVNILYFLAAIFVVFIGGLILILTSDYRRERFYTFVEQTQDPLGKAYHIGQILIALGAGGFWGLGLGQSRQKYLFLPETATDSIFAVIAEEVGFIGAVGLIALFLFFILRGLSISRNAPDKFSQILSVGIVAWIGGQVFLNLGSMVALTPLTGVPLPFFSYGGSSLISVLVATGIILNISRHEEKAK